MIALVAVAAVGVTATGSGSHITGPASPAGGISLAALYCGMLAVLAWRARRVPLEQNAWTRLAWAAAIPAAAATGSALLAVAGLPDELGSTAIGWAPVVAFPLWYGGLVRWNRYRSHLADLNDI